MLFSLPALAEQAQTKDIGITLQLDYLSQWLSKGVPAYGKQGALFKSIDLDFWQSGFGLLVIHRNATAAGYVDKDRVDYHPYAKGQLFEETPYLMTYNLSAEYKNYYRVARNKAKTDWEWNLAINWPNLLPKGFTPGYTAIYEYPAGRGYKYNYITGWVHKFILNYDFNIPEFPAPLRLSSEVAYTDGLGGANHAWSYATFGLSSTFKLNKNMTFIPGIFQQVSMEDTVCDRDVTYCILSMKYKF